eukprot:1451051-Heterocapsa_arctica.AAC.1
MRKPLEDQETTNPRFGIVPRFRSPIYGGLLNGPSLAERRYFADAVCPPAEGKSVRTSHACRVAECHMVRSTTTALGPYFQAVMQFVM